MLSDFGCTRNVADLVYKTAPLTINVKIFLTAVKWGKVCFYAFIIYTRYIFFDNYDTVSAVISSYSLLLLGLLLSK